MTRQLLGGQRMQHGDQRLQEDKAAASDDLGQHMTTSHVETHWGSAP
jgi:hypothetical protein